MKCKYCDREITVPIKSEFQCFDCFNKLALAPRQRRTTICVKHTIKYWTTEGCPECARLDRIESDYPKPDCV